MTRNLTRSMATVVLIALPACGGASDLVLGELNEDEAQQLAAAVLFATFNSTSVVPPPPAALTLTGASGWAMDFEAEVKCPEGGIVGVAASMLVVRDESTGAGRAEYGMTQVHSECEMGSGNGDHFSIWGGPRMDATVAAEHDGRGSVEWTGSVEGSVDWTTNDREGSCTLDIVFEGAQSPLGTPVAALQGSICGFALDDSVSIR